MNATIVPENEVSYKSRLVTSIRRMKEKSFVGLSSFMTSSCALCFQEPLNGELKRFVVPPGEATQKVQT
jgi:hypothetical protein